MNTKTVGKRLALGVIGFAAAFSFAIYLGSCTPGNEITAAESDVVVTIYDNTYNFGSDSTYFMPDSVFHLSGDKEETDDPNLDRSSDARIIQDFKDQMAARGYTLVGSSASPDLLMALSATSTDTYSVYSWYPWYGGWGWGGYWYPYYPTTSVNYAYSSGTLLCVMIDSGSVPPGPPPQNPDDVLALPVRWHAALNGVLNDTSSSKAQRVDQGIAQMFDQSPYIKSNR